MKKIIKTVITVTVLTEDVPPEFDSLEELEHMMSYGDAIGTHSVDSHEEVPVEKLEAELLALGNDGTFFEG